jgi:glycine cleavage system pyridoxal-binding protein P
MVIELTGMEIANASYLMKNTAAAECTFIDVRSRSKEKHVNKFFVSEEIYHKLYLFTNTFHSYWS